MLEGEEQRARLEEERARWTGLERQAAALRQQIAAGREERVDRGGASRAAIEETRSKLREAEAAARLAEQEAERQERLLASGLISGGGGGAGEVRGRAERAAVESLRQTLDRLGYEERSTRASSAATSTSSSASSPSSRARRAAPRPPCAGWSAISSCARSARPWPAGSDKSPPSGSDRSSPRAIRSPWWCRQGEIKAIAEFLPASALGRIQPDQRARVVLQSFPAAQYGDLPAIVTRLASEPRDGRIRVELTLRPDRRSRLPLQHGLPGTVEVEVERVSPAVLVLRTVGKVFERPVPAAPEMALPTQAGASAR